MTRPPQWLHKRGKASDGLFVINPGQRIVLWDDGEETLFGCPEETVRGVRCSEAMAGREGRPDRAWYRSDRQVRPSIEVEIFRFVSGGSSTRAMARRLNLGVHSVRGQIQNALDKPGLHSKPEAVSHTFRDVRLSSETASSERTLPKNDPPSCNHDSARVLHAPRAGAHDHPGAGLCWKSPLSLVRLTHHVSPIA